MTYQPHSFDVAFEKATLDSLVVDCKSPWDLKDPSYVVLLRALKEVKNVLRPGGVFISFTFTQPHFRVPLLASQGLGWSIQVNINHKYQLFGTPSIFQICWFRWTSWRSRGASWTTTSWSAGTGTRGPPWRDGASPPAPSSATTRRGRVPTRRASSSASWRSRVSTATAKKRVTVAEIRKFIIVHMLQTLIMHLANSVFPIISIFSQDSDSNKCARGGQTRLGPTRSLHKRPALS